MSPRTSTGRTLIWLVAASALAAVVAVGFDMLLSLGILGAWGACAVGATVVDTGARVQRAVVASACGLAVCFGGVLLQEQPAVAHRKTHAPAADHRDYTTAVIAGFPFRRIEGHGGGGAPDYLPWHKGLGWLIANGVLATALGYACTRVAARVARRQRGTTWMGTRPLACAALLGAAPLALHGWWELVRLVD